MIIRENYFYILMILLETVFSLLYSFEIICILLHSALVQYFSSYHKGMRLYNLVKVGLTLG